MTGAGGPAPTPADVRKIEALVRRGWLYAAT